MVDFDELVKGLNISLTDEMKRKYELYYEILVKENENINLTNIVEKDDVYLKHFYDSLTLTKGYSFKGDEDICDVGAGAGFPSIPLKIAFPNLKITIVDSLRKRTNFLNRLVKSLDLKDVEIIWGRAEEIQKRFSIVTARAVARLNILSELCLPLVREKGTFMAMKGNFHEELVEATKGIKFLGGEIKDSISFNLPIENSERGIIVIDKVRKTPSGYPRSFSAIKKRPL